MPDLRSRTLQAVCLAAVTVLTAAGCTAADGADDGAPTPELIFATDRPEAADEQAPGRARTADEQADSVPVVTATPRPAEEVARPERLSYPAIGADMPVVSVGMAEEDRMEIPSDAAVAGWYRFGSAPESGEGNTVIVSHNASPETPLGGLGRLLEARPGQDVVVTDTEGREHRYEVTERLDLSKEGLDFLPYVTRQGPERLVLITCGGEWDPVRRVYDQNIVVVATPVD